MAESDADEDFIWSIPWRAWYRPLSLGLTRHFAEAGRYRGADAAAVLARVNQNGVVAACLIPVACLAPLSDPRPSFVPDMGQCQFVTDAVRKFVANGAPHRCDEWMDETGHCRLCDRVVP